MKQQPQSILRAFKRTACLTAGLASAIYISNPSEAQSQSQKPVKKDTAQTAMAHKKAKGGYISDEGAAKLYLKLKKYITSEIPKGGNKPAKIAMLEAHYVMDEKGKVVQDAVNSRAYEFMIRDIVYKLNPRINNLMLEVDPMYITAFRSQYGYLVKPNLTADALIEETHLDKRRNVSYSISSGLIQNDNIIGLETIFQDPTEKMYMLRDTAKPIFRQKIKDALPKIRDGIDPIQRFEIDVKNGNMVYRAELNWNAFVHRPTAQEKAEIEGKKEKLKNDSYDQALFQVDQARINPVMATNFANFNGSGVAIFGFLHGQHVVQPYRDRGGICIAFSPCDVTPIIKHPKYSGSGFYYQNAARWAANPKNAHQYEGEGNFKLEGLPSQITHAIKLAEKMELKQALQKQPNQQKPLNRNSKGMQP